MAHHVSADVAWGVWEYWKGTGDDIFMATMGVEIMLETARFWASRCVIDRGGRYHIRVVVGPDEYHEGVDDNAYTNVMARWNISKAIGAVEWLRECNPGAAAVLRERLGLSDAEMLGWRLAAEKLVDCYDPVTKRFEQFAGFYDLPEVELDFLGPRPIPANLLLGREATNTSKVVEQADAVMLCHMLSDEIDDDVAKANLDYYEPMTTHEGSHSSGIHAALAARVGASDLALNAFRLTCGVDLADNLRDTARGLHLAAMGGTWQAAVMGFGGVRRRGESLEIRSAPAARLVRPDHPRQLSRSPITDGSHP